MSIETTGIHGKVPTLDLLAPSEPNRSEIRTKWRFNRAKHFHQLKSFGLKKALHRFKGMRVAQATRLLPLALANYSPPSQDNNRFVSLNNVDQRVNIVHSRHSNQRHTKPHHSSQGVQGGAGGRHGAAERERALPVRARAARRRAPARVGGRVRRLRDLQPHGTAAP
ncbi:unnamed protein product [Chrysodeixis includens]|uniref:Uncharacterized protein n=1 Tax=Chrysodeixis includens TaxID=689277 RepID=A0A9N8KV11_CHRIL|nr:unnamed protein product [Chrysodeixis includens]